MKSHEKESNSYSSRHCFMLFAKTAPSTEAIEYLNQDVNELLRGQPYESEEKLKASLLEKTLLSPIILKLNIGIDEATYAIEHQKPDDLANHVETINATPVVFEEHQFSPKK